MNTLIFFYLCLSGYLASGYLFGQRIYKFKLSHNTPANSLVGKVTISGTNGSHVQINWKPKSNFFSFDLTTLELTTSMSPIPKGSYYFQATSFDRQRSLSNCYISVQVQDESENLPPKFSISSYQFQIFENNPPDTLVAQVKATDPDIGENGRLSYHLLSDSNNPTPFQIKSDTGQIFAKKTLNAELQDFYDFKIIAVDNSPKKLSTTSQVHIRVVSQYDFQPKLNSDIYNISLDENTDFTKRPVIFTVKGFDRHTNSSLLAYSLSGSLDDLNTFEIDNTGRIHLVSKLNYRMKSQYTLSVYARDHGQPSCSVKSELNIHIVNMNPSFVSFSAPFYEFIAFEDVTTGSKIGRILAYDRDQPESVLDYELSGKVPFKIDSSGFIITTTRVQRQIYEFYVTAKTPKSKSSVKVKVKILDLTEQVPLFAKKNYKLSIKEDTAIGLPLLTLNVINKDSNSLLDFSIEQDEDLFSLIRQSSTRIFLTLEKSNLNFKKKSLYELNVKVIDLQDGLYSVSKIEITVSPNTKYFPRFSQDVYSFKIDENSAINSLVGSLSTVSSESQVVFRLTTATLTNNDFRLDDQTGNLYVANYLDRESYSSVTLYASVSYRDKNFRSDHALIQIQILDVNDNAPIFTRPIYQAYIYKNSQIGDFVLRVEATDQDQALNGLIKYSLIEATNAISIDQSSGVVRIKSVIDNHQNFTLMATDSGLPILSGKSIMILKYLDYDKSAPIFDTDHVFHIFEPLQIGSVVGEISARVSDAQYQSDIVYKIMDTDQFKLIPSGKFNRVVLVSQSQHETSVNLTIRAYSGPVYTDCIVEIGIKNMEKVVPLVPDRFKIVFNHFKNYFLTEQAPRVPVTNFDPVFNWTFSSPDKIGKQLINIDPKSGRITLRSVLNSNNLINTSFMVTISDDSGNRVNSTCELIVTMVTENMVSESASLVLYGMQLDSFMNFYYENFTQLVSSFFQKFRKTNVHLFNLASNSTGFNLSLSVSYDLEKDKFVQSSILKQILYSNMEQIKSLLRLKSIIIYEDKSCSIEPCLNFQKCTTISKFNSADSFYLPSSKIQFRSVSIKHDFSCSCPLGFTGNISVMCDTEINLCYSNPCGNNGTCISIESSYVCICDRGYTGRNCQINLRESKCSQLSSIRSDSLMSGSGLCKGDSVCKNLILGGFVCDECNGKDEPSVDKYYTNLCELRAVNFPENSGAYLALAGLENRIRFKVKLTFSTIRSDGVLLYNGRLENKLDFILLVIEDDFLTFKFSLGDSVNEVKIREVSVSDAKWRTVTIEYKSHSVHFSLDNDNLENVDSCELARNANKTGLECIRQVYAYNLPSKCQNQIESCSRFFDLNSPLIIGQDPSRKNPFEGCISNLYINDRLIDLEHESLVNYGTKRGCSPKMNLCELDKAKFGSQCSKCTHIWSDSVKCDCVSGDFDGKKCVGQSEDSVLTTQANSYLLFQEKVLESEKSIAISIDLRLKETKDLSNQTIVYIKFSDNLIFNEFFVYYDPVPKSLILISQNIRNHIRLEINKNDLFGHQYWSNVMLRFNSDGQVSLLLDNLFKKTYLSRHIKNLFEQKFNYRWSIGAYKTPTLYPSTGINACIKNIKLNQEVALPYEAFNVSKGCQINDTCERLAESIYFGNKTCVDTCPASACHNSGNCTLIDKEYECTCPDGYKGNYCQFKKQKITLGNYTCPARWWGIEPGMCGPCTCDQSKNFSPDCDKRSGKCECKPKFYKRFNKASGEEECVPCDCYLDGSSSLECQDYTGQCKCLPGAGITGRKCDKCVSPFAELTLKGNECRQIMSDQCPRAYAFNTWWPRTEFSKISNSSCPKGSVGTAYRSCTPSGWMPTIDLSECRSLNLDSLTNLDYVANSYQAFKLVEDLNTICTKSEADDDDADLIAFESSNLLSTGLNSLYAMDLLLVRNATKLILEYEINNTALFIQDKFFINKIFYIIDQVLSKKYELKINQFNYKTDYQFALWTDLIVRVSEFISVLAKNGHDYALNDEIMVNYENVKFGQNVVSKSSTEFEIESEVKYAFSSMNVASYNLPVHLSLRHGSLSTSTYRVVSNVFILSTESESQDLLVKFLLSNNYDVVYDPVKNHLSYNNLRNSKIDYMCVKLNTEYKIWSSFGAKFVSYEPSSNVVTCKFDNRDGIFAVITPVGTFVRNQNNILNFTIGFSILVGLSLIILSISMILIILIKKTRRPLKVVQLNLCLNIYLNQLIFVVGVNANESQIVCKLVSILEHYFNLSTFFWTLLISLHLYRMVSELRDVNKIGVSTPVFYYLIGYIAPLVMVSLSLGIKNDIYTNYQATVNFLNYPKYKLDISSVYCWLNINSFNDIFFIFILPIGTITLLVLMLSMLSYKESKKNTFNQTDINLVNQNLLSVIIFLPFNCLMALFLFLFLNSSLTSQTGSAMVYQHLFAICSLIFSIVIFSSFFVLDSENRECLVNMVSNKLDNCKKITTNEADLKCDKNFMDKIEVVNVNSVNAKYMAYRDFNAQSFSTTSTSENTDNSQISEYVKHMFIGNQNGYFPNLINTTNTDTTESEYNYNYDLNKLNGINNTQSIQECDVVDVGKVLKAKNPSIQNVIGENYRCRSPFAQSGNYVYSPSRFNQDIITGMNTLPKANKPMQISPQFSESMSAGSKNSLVQVNADGTIERKYYKKANFASVANIKNNTNVNIDPNLNNDDNETRV